MPALDVATVAAITTAVVELFKRTAKLSKLEGWYPIVTLVVAEVMALLGGLDFVSGLIAGLVAQGLYDTALKPTVTKLLNG